MNPDARGLILGIAGMVSTIVVSALGLYFTARARVAPMRELLYSKQLDLAQRVFRTFGRARVFAVLLSVESKHQDQARGDIGRIVKRLSILTDEAVALFPTELYVVVKQASDTLTSLVVDYDEGRNTKTSSDRLRGQEAKAALMARTLLGIDELSDESIRLFSKSDNLSGLDEISPDDLLAEDREDEEAL